MENNGSVALNRIVRLKCAVQNYDWGRIGRESTVAQLYERNNDALVEEEKPYSEFWMGTHESGSSYVVAMEGVRKGVVENGGVEKKWLSLKDWIQRNPRLLLGDKVFDKWGPNLPFLFKVLSVAKALSIQAHPDKELATTLHRALPNVYKDANHKPEMALALTDFEALCGFISMEELKCVIQNVPEIVEVVGKAFTYKLSYPIDLAESGKSKDILKSMFTELMSANKDVVKESLSRLISRLRSKHEMRQLTEKENLVLRLEKQYPDDIGVLAAFLFNHVKLSPGQALYLGANEPHAYIYGDCIECMATSDNIVRAGLTPKTRDVQTLCSMLTYKQGLPKVLPGIALDSYIVRYQPPFDEFEVDHCVLPKGTSTIYPNVNGPSIFVVISGEGEMRNGLTNSKELVGEGDVVFVPANTELNLNTVVGLDMYRAGVNTKFLENETI